MKFTPFILFLILIFVLVISIVFSRFFPLWESKKEGMTEGLIDYNTDKSSLTSLTIAPYSSTKQVTKLYDNIYFDTGNSNVLIVDGKSGNTTANVASITNVKVLKSNGDITPLTIKGDAVGESDSSKGTFPSGANWRSYDTDSVDNPHKYKIFYFEWDKARFIHIIKKPESLNNPSSTTLYNIGSFYYNNNGDDKQYINYIDTRPSNTISTSTVSNNSKDSTYVLVSNYDPSNNVYQINSNLFFDINNANIILKSGSDIKVYKRDKDPLQTPYQNLSKTIPTTTTFTTWIVNNEISSGNLVLYMAIAEKTLIAVIKLESSGNVSIDKVVSFNKNGIDNRTGWTPDGKSNNSANTTGTNDFNSEYNKWLSYWNAIVNSNTGYSDDYMLKTQVVPPVCPTCPNCPSSGLCTNCGGKGGSGTLGGDGSSKTGGDGGSSNLTLSGNGGYATTANADTLGGATTIQTMEFVKGTENLAKTAAGSLGNVVDTAGNIIKGAGTGTVDVLKSAGSGASNLLSSGASGTAGFIKDAASSVSGFVKDTASSAVGLAKDTVGGAIDLAKDAGSGIANTLANNRYQGSQYSQYGVYNPQTGQTTASPPQYGQQAGSLGNTKSAIDPYSYNGALVSKSSNFIPVTADFSSFGK